MDDQGKSHSSVVPEKSPNKAQAAEGMEGRGLAKGKTLEHNTLRTQGRDGVQRALERIREAAKDKTKRFTALFHQVYSQELLRESYFNLKRDAAPGIDGETWRHYGEQLEEDFKDLSGRLKRGAYRARPTRRGVHTEDRRTQTADRSYGIGRQDRPAGRHRGVERHL